MGRRNGRSEVYPDGAHGAICSAGSAAKSSPDQISWCAGFPLQAQKTNRSQFTGTKKRWLSGRQQRAKATRAEKEEPPLGTAAG